MDSSGPCQNLFKWLSTFEDCGRVSLPEDISSGVVVAKVLHQIEPVWFSQAWLDKINTDTGDNWRLKARNLKKVSQAVVDYLGDNLEFDVSHLSQPDPNKLAEHGDMEEAARLVQLVLGVAINCPRKQEFIEAIRMLEPSVQTVLMTAIQQLMTSPAGVTSLGQPDSCNSWLAEAGRLSQELQLAREERDTLSQRCFEQQRQLQMLQSDKAAALSDLQQLQSRTRESVDTRPSPTDPSDSPVLPSGGQRYKQLRMKLDAAHDEIYRLETSRDELKSKFEESSRELAETRTRVEELQRMADESRGLKDELDILRERSSKMSQYESSLETYKRRLHEMSDLRGQIRSLEQKNSEYVKLNCELEEKVAKSGCYRPQLDICKQRIAELHVQLTEEGSKLERVEMERRALSENLATLQQERDRVTDDRDRMKEALEELRLSQLAQQSSPSEANVSIRPADTLQQSKLASHSNHPAEIRDELLGGSVVPCRREELQSASGSPSDTVDSGAGDFRQREAAQRAEIRLHKQRVQELEMKLAQLTTSGGITEQHARQLQIIGLEQELHAKTSQMDEIEVHTSAQAVRCRELQDQLAKRDVEMAAMEERYKKYLEKAKAVVRSLDSKVNPAGVASIDVGVLRYQLAEKDKIVDALEKENERFKSISASEQKLMSTAFHNLGMELHRQAIEHRLNQFGSGQQSFLTRSRQVSMRRRHANSDFYD